MTGRQVDYIRAVFKLINECVYWFVAYNLFNGPVRDDFRTLLRQTDCIFGELESLGGNLRGVEDIIIQFLWFH